MRFTRRVFSILDTYQADLHIVNCSIRFFGRSAGSRNSAREWILVGELERSLSMYMAH